MTRVRFAKEQMPGFGRRPKPAVVHSRALRTFFALLMALPLAAPAAAAPPGASAGTHPSSTPSASERRDRERSRGASSKSPEREADREQSAEIRARYEYFRLQRATGGGIPLGAREHAVGQAQQLPPGRP